MNIHCIDSPKRCSLCAFQDVLGKRTWLDLHRNLGCPGRDLSSLVSTDIVSSTSNQHQVGEPVGYRGCHGSIRPSTPQLTGRPRPNSQRSSTRKFKVMAALEDLIKLKRHSHIHDIVVLDAEMHVATGFLHRTRLNWAAVSTSSSGVASDVCRSGTTRFTWKISPSTARP